MAQIRKEIVNNGSLTILSVVGKVTYTEVIGALNDFYNQNFTLNLLWDFSEADLQSATSEELQKIIAVAKGYAHLRLAGKTGVIMKNDLGFGLGRMYEILSEIKEHPIYHHIFRSKDEALAWLETHKLDAGKNVVDDYHHA